MVIIANIFQTWLNKNLKNYHNKITSKKFVVNEEPTEKYLHTSNTNVNGRTLYKKDTYPFNIYAPTSIPYGYDKMSNRRLSRSV